MRILIVAMSNSIHTARWIHQIRDENWEIYLYPSYLGLNIHPELRKVRFCIPLLSLRRSFFAIGLGGAYTFLQRILTGFLLKIYPEFFSALLSFYIKAIRPDVIHTLETQGAGYLVSKVKAKYFKRRKFPVWWHTNWGSDIYLFGQLSEHQPLIRQVLQGCDFYSCECQRDLALAESFGFNGVQLPVYPNTGGFRIKDIEMKRSESKLCSERKLIMLKGYQGWAGRALVGLRALERCADVLGGYTIIIYSNPNGKDVAVASKLFTKRTGIEVRLLPTDTPHQEILSYHLKARVSIGLSISDAISTSLLEAMAMGAFPIQSSTACACEWVVDGETGFIVPPEDPEVIELAIRKALLDSELVNRAAEKNLTTIREKADYYRLRDLTIESYNQIWRKTNG